MIDNFRGQYFFLSNFYPSPVEYGIWFPSVEHAYQAAKSHDLSERARIATLRTAREAKTAGRRVTLRPDWDEKTKLQVMYYLVSQKFSRRNPQLHEMLQATGSRELIEGNDWGDRFWGQVDGVGQNHLGKILMQVRAETR